jgi:hypothetical protein
MRKLAEELKKKFRTPAEAVAALGLDAAILDEEHTENERQISMKTISLSPKAALAKGSIMTWLRPKLATDAKLDLNPILEGVNAKNFSKQKKIIAEALKIATRGRLAQDADIDDLPELLQAIEAERGADVEEPNSAAPPIAEKKEEGDEPNALLEFLKGKLQPEDLAQVADMMSHSAMDNEEEERKEREWQQRSYDARKRLGRDETEEEREDREKKESAEDARARLGRDESEEERNDREEGDKKARDARAQRGFDRRSRDQLPSIKGTPEVGGSMQGATKDAVTKDAMDAALKDERVRSEASTAKAIAAATHARDEQHRLAREAEKFVRPLVGELAIAYDSAEEIYRAALQMRNVNIEGMHPSAYRPVLEQVAALPKQRDARQDLGMDAKATASFDERYPGANRIRSA